MSYTCSEVKIRPSNLKHTEFNEKNDERNPRIVVTLNEYFLTKYLPMGRFKKKKVVHQFINESKEHLTEMPIRLWITPENDFYQFLQENKGVDAWFNLTIAKSWGPFYDVTHWKMGERLDLSKPSPTTLCNILGETRHEKLTRIAEEGFDRIFEEHPKFVAKVSSWSSHTDIQAPSGYNLGKKHQALINKYQEVKRNPQTLDSFNKELSSTLVTPKVIGFLTEKLDAPLIAGLVQYSFYSR